MSEDQRPGAPGPATDGTGDDDVVPHPFGTGAREGRHRPRPSRPAPAMPHLPVVRPRRRALRKRFLPRNRFLPPNRLPPRVPTSRRSGSRCRNRRPPRRTATSRPRPRHPRSHRGVVATPSRRCSSACSPCCSVSRSPCRCGRPTTSPSSPAPARRTWSASSTSSTRRRSDSAASSPSNAARWSSSRTPTAGRDRAGGRAAAGGGHRDPQRHDRRPGSGDRDGHPRPGGQRRGGRCARRHRGTPRCRRGDDADRRRPGGGLDGGDR